MLRRRGVALVSVTENLDETASGRLVEGTHALMAEFYSPTWPTRSEERTRKLSNTAVIDEIRVRDGRVAEAVYKEPFDLLFAVPKFEYGDAVGREGFEPP